MTIQEYIKKNYPNHHKSGKWGCCKIGFDNVAGSSLEKEYPHGFQVSVGVAKKYWVWLDKD